HWAQPIDTPPYKAYPLRPGITFTYLGLKVNEHAAVHFDGIPSNNLFVAGEMMAGNILGNGYIAGVGMSIGTVFGRIAGTRAAEAALAGQINHLEKVIYRSFKDNSSDQDSLQLKGPQSTINKDTGTARHPPQEDATPCSSTNLHESLAA